MCSLSCVHFHLNDPGANNGHETINCDDFMVRAAVPSSAFTSPEICYVQTREKWPPRANVIVSPKTAPSILWALYIEPFRCAPGFRQKKEDNRERAMNKHTDRVISVF
jgi:hypothetical protein